MTDKQSIARCLCMRTFVAATDHEALGKLRKHVENLADLGELHGLKTISSQEMEVPELMIQAALREEVERLLEERKVEEGWDTPRELELTRQMLRWTVMQAHEGLHSWDKESWRQCRNAICLYAQMVLPEVEEVEWT